MAEALLSMLQNTPDSCLRASARGPGILATHLERQRDAGSGCYILLRLQSLTGTPDGLFPVVQRLHRQEIQH